ncbi:MAG: MerR family transcriptional regulator [Gemmatimonadaceae bacterium]
MDNTDPSVEHPGTIPEHGIAVVEHRTGISQHLLRAWERRYGVVTPGRTEAGQRLYSDEDIERLRLVRIVTAAGRRVGQVTSLSLTDLRELARRDASESIPAERPEWPARGRGAARTDVADPTELTAAEEHLHACAEAVERLDGGATYTLLMRAAVALNPRGFIDGVAVPLLRRVGDDWENGTLPPTHEHVLSVALRRVLSWLVEVLPAPAGAPLVMFATLPDQRHEFGAMLAAAVAASKQWRVSYLGADLPVNDIAHAALLARADVVAVSVLGPIDLRVLRREVGELRAALPASVSLIAGGETATAHARALRSSGATVLPDLGAWDAWLETIAAERL